MGNVILSNVKKAYGDTTVVEDLSLTIEDGEFIVLVGPSGCGKSTTLRMIAGLEDMTAGSIHIAGNNVGDLPPHKRNIAMVFQNYALYPHKSVRDNILFGLKKTGASQEVMRQRLDKVTDILQLEDYLDRKPADLSGGQRQRVAMGRALVRDAAVFLFDEPLSNLDAKLRHHMRTEIAKIHQRYKTTSIYVTHDQVEAMTLGDRVVVMRDGNIEQVGTPMELYLQPVNTFVATFIGSPSMNLIDAEVTDEGLAMGGHRITLDGFLNDFPFRQGQKLIVGIRPDFFEDATFVQEATKKAGQYAQFADIRVELVEPLGFDREVIFSIGDTTVKARLDLRSDISVGEDIQLVVDLRRMLFFDPGTGTSIDRNA